MPPDPPTEAAMRLLPPLAAWLLEPPPIQNPGYATAWIPSTDLIHLVHVHTHYSVSYNGLCWSYRHGDYVPVYV